MTNDEEAASYEKNIFMYAVCDILQGLLKTIIKLDEQKTVILQNVCRKCSLESQTMELCCTMIKHRPKGQL